MTWKLDRTARPDAAANFWRRSDDWAAFFDPYLDVWFVVAPDRSESSGPFFLTDEDARAYVDAHYPEVQTP